MNLLDTYPNIANEWHPSLNAISPQDVAPHFHKKVWWMCGCGHEWESVIKTTYDNMRKRTLECEIKYFDCAF